MKFVFVLVVLALAIAGTECLVCTKDYCSLVDCAQVTKADCHKNGQIFVKNGSTCGCCDACLTVIKKGESCQASRFRGGAAPTAECQKGTTCTNVGNDTYKCE